jgi:hypothetical protein
MNQESPKPRAKRGKNQIVIDIGEENITIKSQWTKNVDVDIYGKVLSLAGHGMLRNYFEESIVTEAERSGDYDTAGRILDANKAANDMLQEHITSAVYDEVSSRKIEWHVMEFQDDPDYNEEEDEDENPAMKEFIKVYRQHQHIFKLPERPLWWMITNFDLVPLWDRIEKFPGIEVATPFQRYTAIIGVGKLFDSPKVRKDLEDMLLGSL